MIPAALRVPAFRRLVLSTTLLRFGGMMTYIALPVVAWEETGSAAVFASILTAGSLALVQAMPFGGVLADRFDRRCLMITGDLTGAFGAVLVLAAVHFDAWYALVPICASGSLTGSLFASAGPALRREALPDELREEGTAALQLGVQSSQLVAPALGVAMYAAWGFEVVIAVEILTYLTSCLLIVGMRGVPTKPERMPASGGVVGAFTTGLRDLRDGYRITVGDTFLAAQLRYVALTGFSNSLLLVGAVPWIDESLHRPASTWGVLISVLGGAGIIASLVLTTSASRIRTDRLLLVATCAPVLAAIVFAGWTPIAAVIVAFALFGAAHVACAVASEAITQRRVTSELMGRVYSLSKAVFQIAMFAGIIVGGAIIHATSPAWSMRVLAVALVGEAVGGIALVRASRTPTSVERDAADADLAVSG